MTNQQKINLDFLYRILRRRRVVMLLAFHLNPKLFNDKIEDLIREVIHREWGYEGYHLKHHLYVYLEETKSEVGGTIGNYGDTIKAINSPILKTRKRILKDVISISKKGK